MVFQAIWGDIEQIRRISSSILKILKCKSVAPSEMVRSVHAMELLGQRKLGPRLEVAADDEARTFSSVLEEAADRSDSSV